MSDKLFSLSFTSLPFESRLTMDIDKLKLVGH